MTPVQKISVAVVAVVLLVIILTAASLVLPQPESPSEMTFSCVGVSTSSNTSSASILIRNPSSSKRMIYTIGDPEFKSGGLWGPPYLFRPGTIMQSLAPRHSVTNSVTAPVGSGEARVPVLWSYMSAPGANKWQQLWNDVGSLIRMHNARGGGALYTNYVTGIKM